MKYLILVTSLFLISCSPVPGEQSVQMPVEYSKSFKGLSCKIWRDTNGHVHVKSDTELGVVVGFGYAQAKDRAWQMDYFRRVVQGRTAEVHGFYKLKTDVMMRLLGLYGHAEKIVAQLDPQTAEWLWAYSYGVNTALQELDFTNIYEFKKLGYKPALWSPVDSIALILLQSFDQTRETFGKEITEQAWITKHGKDKQDLFMDNNLPWDTSILKKGEYTELQITHAKSNDLQKPTSTIAVSNSLAKELSLFFGSEPLLGIGSNNWIIAPKLSETGHAFLENDPHLQLRHPSFWHWIHLQGPKTNAMGASFPGIPMITSGFNDTVAWGVTNSYLDTGKVSYVSEDQLTKAESFRPTIWVNFYGLRLPFVFKTLRRVEGHPILPLEAPPGKAIVLDWTGYLVGASSIKALSTVMKTQSVTESLSTFKEIEIPSWNFVFADTNGNIGYTVSGRILKHLKTTPFGITDLPHGQSFKQELLEKSEMPYLYNPKRGYVVTANNHQWPQDAKWHGGYAYRTPFRAYRIEELLLKSQRHNFDSMKNIACDVLATDARFINPLLVGHLEHMTLNQEEQEGLSELKKWDFQADLDCVACAIFRRTMDRLMNAVEANDAFIYRWLKSANANEVEAILKPEFSKALEEIRKPFNGKLPAWGDIHKIFFRNPSDDKKFLNSRHLPTPGDDNTINPGSSEWEGQHFAHVAGASQRMIVELSKPPRAIVQLAGENIDSETPDFTSPESGFKRWTDCTFQEAQFQLDWSQVEAASVQF